MDDRTPHETADFVPHQGIEFVEVDARSVSGPFLPYVLKHAKSLSSQQGLHVIQSFEPRPLYNVMAEMGFKYSTRQASNDEFHVYFYRESTAGSSENKSSATSTRPDQRVPIVLQSATPIAIPLILRLQQSEALAERIVFEEVKIWEKTEKHLAWIAKGKADVSFTAVMAASKMLSGRESIKLASVVVWDNFTLVGRVQDATSFASLRGKTIHLPLVPNSPPGRVTLHLMRALGERPEDFKLVFGKKGDPFGRPEEISRKLVSGEIDIAVLREPEASFALAQDDTLRVIVDYGKEWRRLHPSHLGLPNAGVVFKSSFAERHPDVVQLFLKELEKAVDWVVQNPLEATELSHKTIGHPVEQVRLFLERANFQHVLARDVFGDLNKYLRVLSPEGNLQLTNDDLV